MSRRNPSTGVAIERNCRNCGKVFIVPVPSFRKTFCKQSCAATFGNTGRIRTAESRARSSASHYAHLEKYGYHKTYTGRTFPDITLIRRAECTQCGKAFWSRRQRRVKNHYSLTCTDECFLKAKKANASGIKRTSYNGVEFDSQWEVEVAKSLDASMIIWIRPTKAIVWIDRTGKSRRYFPDFYIPDLDLFLDPKNPLVIKRQREKLDIVSNMIKLIYGRPSDIMSAVIEIWRSR
jgi:hypothetical protein